ncbi:hypothetical protein FPV67DRAFT_1481745 [Lyophyllum atratum]|nr:hypothetical protein FPV67DRAFT_1481745 [Lyophyllum atratum]
MVSTTADARFSMMFYHDGLRIIAAEKARHSSKNRATPSDSLLDPCYFRTLTN